MRTVPDSMSGGAMTLARCWRVTRTDGVVMGFTDHDGDLVFDGVTHAAGTGLEAADMSAELGFAITGGEVAGALSAHGLTEADIAGGRYDGATVAIYLVDWSAPDKRVLLDSGAIGEIKRMGTAFVAEIRSLAYRLDEERGRLFRPACSADLGDGRCGVALGSSGFLLRGTVLATDGRSYLEATADGFVDGWFTGGALTFVSGANAGFSVEVKAHGAMTGKAALTLWRMMGGAIAVGDGFTVTAGCDKSIGVCQSKFGNIANFRGFPHMPGNDFVVMSISDGQAGLDGGSFFR